MRTHNSNSWLCLIIVFLTTGCGESVSDRKAIAEHLERMMITVKSEPTSEQGRAALSELIDILNGDWSFARTYACNMFVELGPLAGPAVPDLMRAAMCGDGFVEQEAVHALASVGPAAAPAVELFIEIIQSIPDGYDPGLKSKYAFEGVSTIGESGRKAIPVLEDVLRSSSEKQVRLAREALKTLNPAGFYEPLIELHLEKDNEAGPAL